MSAPSTPTYELELRAVEQRKRLHDSMSELKTQVRDKFDVQKNAREHLLAASGIASVMALLAGYGIAGLFTRR